MPMGVGAGSPHRFDSEGVAMPLEAKRSTTFAARTLRRVLPARRSRQFIVGGVVAAMTLLSTTAAAAAGSDGAAHARVSGVSIDGPSLPGFRQGLVSVDGGTIHYVIGGGGAARRAAPRSAG